MANIGSVFLGDNVRHRMLSSSSHISPPSSPPPSSPPASSISAVFPLGITQSPSSPQKSEHPPKPPKTPIDPRLALELRLSWLEALLVGVGIGACSPSKTAWKSIEVSGHTLSLYRAAEGLQRRLDGIIASNDGVKRFLAQYDQHAHFFSPAFALSDPSSEKETTMSVAQLEVLLTEMEPDIRAAERDLHEIQMLESKGVTAVGKLGSYEELQPRFDELLVRYRADAELVASLEKRIANLMERHATQVDTLSELFVAWDDTVTDVEDKVTRLEKERSERRRLGFEQ